MNEYFVTHSAGCIPCDSISREKPDGTYEEITYQQIADMLNENQKLKQFQNKVFDLIDTKIKEETYSAEMIKKTLNINEDYVEPVNILTIKALEQLKKELQ